MKVKLKILILLQILLLSVWLSAENQSDFKAAVASVGKEFQAAIAAKDSARAGAIYTRDAMVFPPNSEMIKGREAIRNYFQSFIDSGMGIQVQATETEDQGDLGIEVGTYAITDSSGKNLDHGKYVVVYKKEGGTWRVHRDIWNTDLQETQSK